MLYRNISKSTYFINSIITSRNWNKDIFPEILKNFMKNFHPTVDNTVILNTDDRHESHIGCFQISAKVFRVLLPVKNYSWHVKKALRLVIDKLHAFKNEKKIVFGIY